MSPGEFLLPMGASICCAKHWTINRHEADWTGESISRQVGSVWRFWRRCFVEITNSLNGRRRWPLHVRCCRKKFTFAISSPDEFLLSYNHDRGNNNPTYRVPEWNTSVALESFSRTKQLNLILQPIWLVLETDQKSHKVTMFVNDS